MAKLSLCLAFVMGFIALSYAEPLSRSAVRITTPPPAFDCKGAKLVEYNKKCCNVNPAELFPEEATKACNEANGKSKDNIAFIEDYMMNKYQDKNKGNMIDFTDKNVVKTLSQAACFIQCLFVNATAITPDSTDGAVDATALTRTLQNQAFAIWDKPIADAVTKCTDLVKDFTPKSFSITSGKPPVTKTCFTSGVAYMQCVRYEMIGACPTDKEPQNPPKECAEGTNAQDNCRTVFTTTAAPSGGAAPV